MPAKIKKGELKDLQILLEMREYVGLIQLEKILLIKHGCYDGKHTIDLLEGWIVNREAKVTL